MSEALNTSPLASARKIDMPAHCYAIIVGHASRKLAGHYLPGETAEKKAFGLIAGQVVNEDRIAVTAAIPLFTNLRQSAGYRDIMDTVVNSHAIPSETPLDRRGWLADPREVIAAERTCDERGWLLVGDYHTHRVAWPTDPLRDTCTELDAELARDSGTWTFILSVVDLERPLLRAFFEGRNEHEAGIDFAAATPDPASVQTAQAADTE